MSRKKDRARDARFRNRETPRPSSPPEASPSGPVSGAHPLRPSGGGGGGGRPWFSANLIVPLVLALGLAAAVYAMMRPTESASTAGAGDAATDGAVAAVAPAEAGPAPPVEAGAAAPQGGGEPVEAAHPEPSTPDPRQGRFALSDATAGLEGTGPLVAEIETSLGTFTCDLLSDEAPNTVANFVGLARGLRDFWDPVAGQWARRPFYDGSVFHRVIPEFMIQGGDVLRSGFGGTGYEFADENVRGHNAAGQLCMANHGPNTNGGQFFITEQPRAHLDGSYSIFGRCRPVELVARIARVERNGERPATAVTIRHVRIRR